MYHKLSQYQVGLSPYIFKIKAMGDEVGDCGGLRELNVVYGSQIVLRENVILMNKRIQSVGYNSF